MIVHSICCCKCVPAGCADLALEGTAVRCHVQARCYGQRMRSTPSNDIALMAILRKHAVHVPSMYGMAFVQGRSIPVRRQHPLVPLSLPCQPMLRDQQKSHCVGESRFCSQADGALLVILVIL